jgi:hypothetical protein
MTLPDITSPKVASSADAVNTLSGRLNLRQWIINPVPLPMNISPNRFKVESFNTLFNIMSLNLKVRLPFKTIITSKKSQKIIPQYH